jgi:hypothetical protein
MPPRLRRVFFNPPLAIARLGGSDTPLEAFKWVPDTAPEAAHGTMIQPTITLAVKGDGSVDPYMPETITFRDGERLRPVAPFFELWAELEDGDGELVETPVTLNLLKELRSSTKEVRYTITVANRKAQRRTGSASCAFIAEASVSGAYHEPTALLACSPRNPDQAPLVDPAHPIPLGCFQVIKPVDVAKHDVDLAVLRVRFTPARGHVYGPRHADVSAASPLPPGEALPAQTIGGRLHEIVPPENRILNPYTPWTDYVMDRDDQQDPQPSDSYDGANIGDNQSWGVVDDTCDGIITADVVVDGERYSAFTRVVSACPDYAPDHRTFFSFADDLADRDLGPAVVNAETIREREWAIADLFARALETVSLMNVDATRDHGIYETEGKTTDHPAGTVIDQRTMTGQDPLAARVPLLLPEGERGRPNDPLPYTRAAGFVHRPMADIETLLGFLRTHRDRMQALLRPPFGRVRELDAAAPAPDGAPNPKFRDPRVRRDAMQDMRMPPYMRDSDQTPLSLTRRQYDELMAVMEWAATVRVRAYPGGPTRPDGPLAWEVAKIVAAERKSSPERERDGGPV